MGIVASQLVGEVTIKGGPQGKQQLDDMDKSTNTLSGSFKSMLGNALSFAAGQAVFNLAGQAVGFLKNQVTDSIQLAIQHNQILQQTAQALKSTADASGMTQAGIEALAQSQQNLTGINKDTIEGAENLELTFTGIGKDVFPSVLQAAEDMATSLHTDLSSAMMQVAKATNDPKQGLTALTREGVTFSEQEKQMITKMEASGNTMGAQKIMLGELAKEFGGSAQAAGQTFGGQLQILKDRLDDTKEKIATALMPAMQGFVEVVSAKAMPILDDMGNWMVSVGIPALENFGSIVGRAWAILDNKGLTTLIDSLRNLGETVGGIVSPALQSAGNFLKSAFSDQSILSTAQSLEGEFYRIAGGVDTLNSDIKSLTVFFQSNSVQAQAVKDVLVGVGVALASIQIQQFVTSAIPKLVLWATTQWEVAAAALATAAPYLLAGAVIALAVGGVILVIQHWSDITKTVQNVSKTVLADIQSTTSSVLGAVASWWKSWGGLIEWVGGTITLFFLPAMVQAGVAAVVSGAQVTANFIQAAIMAGTRSVVSGAQMTANFIAGVVESGTSSVVSGAQMTASLIPSIISSGTVSVITGAQIAGNFVRSVVMAGIEGWQAAGKLGVFIAQMVVSGARAVATGAMMVASFVAGLISAGVEAVVSAGIFLATLVPSLLAVAAGVIAATWPFLAIGAVVALVVAGVILAIQHWGDITKVFQSAWHTAWDDVQGVVQDGVKLIQDAIGGFEGIINTYLVQPFENGLGRIGAVFQTIAKLIQDATSLNFGAIPGDLHGLGIPGFASGTSYAPGGWANLAEQGMELVTGPGVGYLPPGAKVYSTSQTAQMMSGGYAGSGGGQPIILVMDGRAFARGYMPYHVEAARNVAGVRF